MAQRRDIEANFRMSVRSIGAVEGLREALAQASGSPPAELRTWPGLRAACRRIAEANERPEGLVGFAFRHGDEPVTEGGRKRKVEALRLVDPRDAVKVAHAFTYDAGPLRVVVKDAFAGEIGALRMKRLGQKRMVNQRAEMRPLLRADYKPRALSADKAVDAQLRAALDEAKAALDVRFIEGAKDGSDGFVAAVADVASGTVFALRSVEPVSVVAMEGRDLSERGDAKAIAEALRSEQSGEVSYRAPLQEYWVNRSRDFVNRRTIAEQRSIGEASEKFNKAIAAGAVRTSAFRFGDADGFVQSTINSYVHVQRSAARIKLEKRIASSPMQDMLGVGRDPGSWNTLALVDGLTAEGARRVTQACAASPFVKARVKVGAFEDSEGRSRIELVKQIAGGSSLAGAIKACLKVVHGEEASVLDGASPAVMAGLAAYPGKFPVNLSHALVAYAAARPLSPRFKGRDFDALDSLVNTSIMPSFQDCGKVTPASERFARYVDAWRDDKGRLPSGKQLAEFERGIDQYRWIRDRVELSAGVDSNIAATLAISIMTGDGRRQGGMIKASDAWHRSSARYEGEMHTVESEARRLTTQAMSAKPLPEAFPHLTKDTSTFDGVVVEPLRSHERIIQEGKEHDHCVASYRGYAETGEAILLGLSSSNGRSTVELSFEGEQARIKQHFGVNNSAPPEGHGNVVNKWLQAHVTKQGVECVTAEAERLAAYFGRSIGAEFKPMVAVVAMRQLDDFLPANERGLSPEKWLATFGKKRLETMVPKGRQARVVNSGMER